MADSMQQVVRVYLEDAIMCERPPRWAKHAVDFFYVAPASNFLSTNPLRTGLADATANELRASVLDAALQLGLMRDDRFAEWIFDDRVVTPNPGAGEVDKRRGEEIPQESSVLPGGDGMAGDMSSANSSSTSLNLQVKQLEEAYTALASTRLTRAATRKGGRTGPSHQASQSEVLSFSRQDAVAGSSSTLARSATFSSRSPTTLQIDPAKSNAPFITVTHDDEHDDDDREVSYVSTIWGKELLQSYDIELTSAPPTPVSNSPLSRGPPLPSASSSQSSLHNPARMPPLLSASPTNASFTSSDNSLLHTPAEVSIPPARRVPPPAINIPSEDTTPRLPPTPPLVVKKHHPTSPGSGHFVPITPSSSISQLSSPPPTPYSAASPDSPTLPWTKDQLGDRSSARNKLSPSKPLPTPNSTPSSPSQSPYTSLFSRLSFRRKSKNSVASAGSGKDLPPIPPSSHPSPLYPPPSPYASRTVNAKALSSPPPKTTTRVPITISHVSMDALKSSTLSPSPITPSPKQQIRGRISPFPVRPIRKQPLSPSSSTLPSPASPVPPS
ncbi:hypothetical protein PC9H_002417 [Pleurotus ostreatus]|uniref:Uncharacterized protein n=1 Tax=Pleurotus ostreatus TaxID=5322 RepID=A0A8H6ZJR8_PLEOS|nr:uncharacterized protein PC9H_002417 [Pleurotus ostreatus]KAF7416154.1 hypothetical protein PC9H_002417 [Pleurotus ostreatus]